MSIEPSSIPIDYVGWRCGACNGPTEPDGLCAACAEEYAIQAEIMYVDPYEKCCHPLDDWCSNCVGPTTKVNEDE